MRKGLLCAVAVLAVAAALCAQDPVKADPQHYKVVAENDQVRVLLVTYGPGEKSPLHEHPNALAIALTDRHERITNANGAAREVNATAGDLSLSGGKHSAENLGDKPFQALLVEFKTPDAMKAASASLDGLMKQKLGANESSAVAFLRTINTAEYTFRATYKKGFTEGLNRMGPPAAGANPEENHADFLQPWLAGLTEGGTDRVITRNGYRITYTPGPGEFGSIKAYTVVAQPVQYGITGVRSFFTDETAKIRGTGENRPATANDPPL